MTMDQIPGLGTADDMQVRLELARVDSEQRQKAIVNARKIIYQDGYAVTSDRVEQILKPQSLVPTEVSALLLVTRWADMM